MPIARDGAWHRLPSHLEAGWEISSILMKSDLKFLAVLRMDDPPKRESPNVLGMDINAGSVAVTILCFRGKVLKQLYLGQDLAGSRHDSSEGGQSSKPIERLAAEAGPGRSSSGSGDGGGTTLEPGVATRR